METVTPATILAGFGLSLLIGIVMGAILRACSTLHLVIGVFFLGKQVGEQGPKGYISYIPELLCSLGAAVAVGLVIGHACGYYVVDCVVKRVGVKSVA